MTKNEQINALVLAALPGTWLDINKTIVVAGHARWGCRYGETYNAIQRLKRARKIRYSRAKKVWEAVG